MDQTVADTKLGTEHILDALVAEGLSHLFMVPGALIDPFLPALAQQERIKPVIAAHEGGAVYMADGYARASGRLGSGARHRRPRRFKYGHGNCCRQDGWLARAGHDGRGAARA
jgi:hypothetical protein